MENLSKTKVSAIVAQNYRTAKVFTAKGIDFCCNGGILLEEACEKKQVDVKGITEEINQAMAIPEAVNFDSMPLDELVGYIENTHHTYVRNTVPTLMVYLKKVARVHGARHPELLKVKKLFIQSASELMHHMAKEEGVLFPFIREMMVAVKENVRVSRPLFGHVENPIRMMESEHAQEGKRFKEISELTHNYNPPSDACQTYRVTYAILKEFEEDLHMHIHLENNILFPHAISVYNLNVG